MKGKKKEGGEGGGGRVFERFRSRKKKIKDLVDTDVRNIVCDPPIARISQICRGLLYARCWV